MAHSSGEFFFLILSMYFHYFNIILHFCYYLPLEKSVGFYLKKHESPPSKDAFCQIGRNWPRGSGEKRFKYFQYNFTIISTGEGRGPSFEQTWILSIQGCFVPFWLKLAQWFWRKRFLSIFNVIFATISTWKKAWPLNWTNLNSFYTRMLCGKFGWNWPTGYGDDFFKFQSCVLAIS